MTKKQFDKKVAAIRKLRCQLLREQKALMAIVRKETKKVGKPKWAAIERFAAKADTWLAGYRRLKALCSELAILKPMRLTN